MFSHKVMEFQNPKCGQILCAHKPYFLNAGHILLMKLLKLARETHNGEFNAIYRACIACIESEIRISDYKWNIYVTV